MAPTTLSVELWATAMGKELGILTGLGQEGKREVGDLRKGSGFSLSAAPVELEDFKTFNFNGILHQKNEIICILTSHSCLW